MTEQEAAQALQSASTMERVRAARLANPEASHAEIGRQIGLTGQRVGQIENELKAKQEPKLLNHGANQYSGHDNNNILKTQGTSKPYLIARLERDGYGELHIPEIRPSRTAYRALDGRGEWLR